ncbi:MAG TPA: hypothetical protein PKO22_10100, partial [Treponemataceae bacterium]|nr:hypothetical protein [Treponemataceae bacterium]
MIHKNVATTAFLAAMLAFAPVSASLGAFALETEASWSDPDVDAARFHEIWGYLMTGEERYLDKTMPVSDVGYFGAGLSV